uniref:G_PROTEIN_RECEP_F1_2 domain-containing protein n=1 Tax=Steinernema glaseri TaxID=37863 RepID=A0A1I8ATV3_9BILA
MVPVANVVVGCVYCIIAISLLSVNAVVLFILCRHKEFQTNTYRIIKNMILGCMMQLCSHFTGGLMTISNCNLNYYLERIAGAWIQSGWFLYLGASLALAIDRTQTFVFVWSERTTAMVSYGFLAFSWVIALVYMVGLMIPGYGFTYHSSSGYFDWFYDKQPGTQAYLTLEMCLDFSILVTVLSLYFVVFVRVIMMRRSGNARLFSSVVEFRILIIAVISFLYESTYLLWFFWGSNLLPDGVISAVIVTLLWIFDCGLFSVATIIINGAIRRKILYSLCRKRYHRAFVTRVAYTKRLPTPSTVESKA